MDLKHRFVVPASPAVTWAALMDLEGLVPCFPGAALTSVDGDNFAGTVKIKLGPISMVYGGTGMFVARDEAEGTAIIIAKGKDKRGNGTATATVVAQLTPEGSGTAVEVSTDLSVTGKPAQYGRGVIQDVSDKLLGQFVDCIAARLGPDTASQPATPVGGSSQPERPAASVPAADINLVSTVLPVLVKRYGLPVAGIIVVAAIVWIIVK
jgi:carbon monoxide dehydrogenase subunit G